MYNCSIDNPPVKTIINQAEAIPASFNFATSSSTLATCYFAMYTFNILHIVGMIRLLPFLPQRA